MPLFIVALGVILLIVLITGFKLNAFLSLIIVSFTVALALGMPLGEIVTSVEEGLGWYFRAYCINLRFRSDDRSFNR